MAQWHWAYETPFGRRGLFLAPMIPCCHLYGYFCQAPLASATPLHNQVYFTTVYSLGLRLHEALSLQGSDLDGQLLQVHVHRGQGAFRTAQYRAGITKSGVAIHTLRNAST